MRKMGNSKYVILALLIVVIPGVSFKRDMGDM